MRFVLFVSVILVCITFGGMEVPDDTPEGLGWVFFILLALDMGEVLFGRRG